MPLLTRRKLLAAKIETTSGTAETLLAADAAYNVYDLELQPNIPMTQRQASAMFSQLAAFPEGYSATCTFKTDIYGDGVGGVPAWATTFLPACGWTNSAGTFSPKTEAPGSNVKTLTLAQYIDGKRRMMRGCAGTFKLVAETGKIAMIEWTFTGVWGGETDATILAPTYPTALPMRTANSTFTLGSWAPAFAKIEIDAGNEVFLRPSATATDASGYAAAIITGRRVGGTLDPEADLVATAPIHTDWTTPTERALTLTLRNSTDKVTWTGAKTQLMNVQQGDRGGVVINTLAMQMNKSANAGNDELTIAFAAAP